MDSGKNYKCVGTSSSGAFVFEDENGTRYDLFLYQGKDKTGAMILTDTNPKNGSGTLKAYDYHRVQLAIDHIVVDQTTMEVLLIARGRDPYRGCAALPGGFVDLKDNESVEDAALREKKEEIGDGPKYISRERVYFVADAIRDPRAYTASDVFLEIVESKEGFRAGDDAAEFVNELYWVPISTIMKLTKETAAEFHPPTGKFRNQVKGIAFDHLEIMQNVFRQKKLNTRKPVATI